MILTNEIRAAMAKNNCTGQDMAKVLNIAPKTFYLKMAKGVFTTDEAEKLARALKIRDPVKIFFAEGGDVEK